jgi:agmatine deiminase
MMTNNIYTMPAEFEPQSGVWMGWPKSQWYADASMDTRLPLAEVMQILQNAQVSVQLMCSDQDGENAVRTWLTNNKFTITPYLEFVHIDPVDIWQRDFGPIFLRNSNNTLAMASFLQNQWGYSTTTDPVSAAMARVPANVAFKLGIEQNIAVSVASEGGDRIVNGKGVLIVDRAVEFQRNPTLSQDDLETAYKTALGVTKIIWIDAGVREDLHSDWGPIPYYDSAKDQTLLLYGPQTTGGHLDECIRFASANEIILAQVTEDEAAKDPIAAVNYARLEAAYRILAEATDQDGNPFTISRIPVPDLAYRQIQSTDPMYKWLSALKYPASVPPFPTNNDPIYVVKSSSYANYLVSNGVVVAPKYGNTTKDQAAAAALAKANNGRTVKQIDPSAINYAGGGIHCCTQQQPTGSV